MAKRDRDTAIWKDPFYRSLPPLYKSFWDFINDDCDNSGVWGCDFKVASMVIGKKIDQEKAAKLFGGRIEVSGDGLKWWVKTFIPEKLGFEIENLNPAHKFQKSIMDLLIKHKVKNFRVFADTLQSVKEREGQEKGKEREGQGVQGENVKTQNFVDDTLTEWEHWGAHIIAGQDQYWEQMKGRAITQEELNDFLSVATRCGWNMETQHRFRRTLHGFKSTTLKISSHGNNHRQTNSAEHITGQRKYAGKL